MARAAKMAGREPRLLPGRVACVVESVTDDAVFIDVAGSIFRLHRTGGIVPFARGQHFNLRFEAAAETAGTPRPVGPLGVR